MTNAEDSTQPEFWNSRYSAGKTPWDLGGVPSGLRTFLPRAKGRSRVLIPGCGSGYEVKAFHDAGFEVTAIDFSPVAVERARCLAGPPAKSILQGDFFAHNFGGKHFDLVYERTFLCSLPPARWPAYATRMAELLVSGGLLAGVFLYGHESDPPPYPLTEMQAHRLFGDDFELIKNEPVSDSLPLFNEMERWQEWRRV